jgi:hypothetical protein
VNHYAKACVGARFGMLKSRRAPVPADFAPARQRLAEGRLI